MRLGRCRLMAVLMVSAADVNDYRELLQVINSMAQEDIAALWYRLQFDAPEVVLEALRAGVPEVVGQYQAMAADSAAVFYENTQGVMFDVDAVRSASQVDREALDVALRWVVFAPGNADVLSRLSGVVQKHIFRGARQYVLDQKAFRNAGWWRHAQPGACAFCRMLATRSVRDWGEYGSASAADAAGGGKHSRNKKKPDGYQFHDHCRCVPVLASEYEIPSYVEKWDDEYEAAANVVGNRSDFTSILSQMRIASGNAH